MKKKEQAPVEAPLPPRSAPRITPEDIQAKEFRIARLRGYKERDVDEFLDELTLSWGALLDENRRLRSQAGFGASIGAPDLDDAARQADEIIARARQEAARIVAEAGATQGARPAGDDDRTTVSAFLNKERSFLQDLATLVQGHAEGVKGMAREVFAKPEPPADESAPASSEEDVPAAPAEPPPAPSAPAEDDEPIRIEEPEPATVRTSEPSEEPGDRSLKELFWGED